MKKRTFRVSVLTMLIALIIVFSCIVVHASDDSSEKITNEIIPIPNEQITARMFENATAEVSVLVEDERFFESGEITLEGQRITEGDELNSMIPTDLNLKGFLVDIKFEKGGEEIVPEGTVEISINIPDSINGRYASVYKIEEEGDLINFKPLDSEYSYYLYTYNDSFWQKRIIETDSVGRFLIFGPAIDNPWEVEFEIEGDTITKYYGEKTSITLPEGYKKVGNNAFALNEEITSITIPEGYTEIGELAFHGCTNLSEINMPDSLTRIGYAAFSGCLNLKKLTLPTGVQTMYTNAFVDVFNKGESQRSYCYLDELTILNPDFTYFTLEGEETEETLRVSDWADSLFGIQVVYGYEGCYAESLAKQIGAQFIAFDVGSYDDVAVNYSNQLFYAGDVDGNNEVSAEDALEVLKSVVNLIDEVPVETADLDRNGIVDANDALEILKCAVNLREKKSATPSSFETFQYSASVSGLKIDDITGRDYYIVHNREELDKYLNTAYEKLISKHNEDIFEMIKTHFNAYDEKYFEENVCVLTVEVYELYQGTYKLYDVINRDTVENGTLKPKRGIIMSFQEGTDPINQIQRNYILISGTTIPRTEFDGATIDSLTIRDIK